MNLFGLLIARTENLGDDIQSLAARLLIPKVDVYLDRDNLRKILFRRSNLGRIDVREGVKVIMNGWFTHRPELWPPPSWIEPLFVSFCISPHVARFFARRRVVEYLKEHEPIGARDVYTERFLRSMGVDSYFSGCLTLTLGYTLGYTPKRENKVLIIDIKKHLMKVAIDRFTKEGFNVVIFSHDLVGILTPKIVSGVSRLKPVEKLAKMLPLEARNILTSFVFRYVDLNRSLRVPIECRLARSLHVLKEIRSAKLVITSRLHAALPAIAFNTPVVFVHNNPFDSRFSGYLQFMKYFIREKDFINFIKNYKGDYEIVYKDKLFSLKAKLIYAIENFIRG